MASFSKIERQLEAPARPMPLACALLTILLLVMLPTGQLGSNEEHYLQRAYAYVNPDAFPANGAVFGGSTTRVASDVLLGFPVAWLGYERACAVLRVANAAAYATGLALLASFWGLSMLDTLLVLAAFCLMGQQLFGGEWLFQDIEAKTFAYALVLFGLNFGFRRRWLAADVCFVLATWVHLLVGGFWMLFMLVFRCTSSTGSSRVRALWPQVLRYGVGVLPFAIAILLERNSPVSGVHEHSADYVYSIIRNAQHVAPFSDAHILWAWTPGIVSGMGLLAVLLIARRRSTGALRALISSVALVVLFLFLSLGVSWFDRNTGVLGKFFLFRPSSLALLLGLVALAAWLRREYGGALRLAQWMLALWLVPVFLWSGVKAKTEEIVGSGRELAELQQLIDVVNEHSAPGELVLIQPGRDGEPPESSLARRLGRPTWVSWKIVPTAPADLLEWYDRLQARSKLFASACADRAGLEPRLLVGWQSEWDARFESCGELLWRSEKYWVIAVR